MVTDRSKPRPPWMITAVLALGIGLLAVALSLAISRARFLASSEHAIGMVAGVSGEVMRDLNGRMLGNGQRISVRFVDHSGQTVTVRSPVTSSVASVRRGETVEVNYPAGRPDEAVIGTFVDRWLVPLILAFIGGIATMIGGLGVWIARQPGTRVYGDGWRFGMATGAGPTGAPASSAATTFANSGTGLFSRETDMRPGRPFTFVWIVLGLVVAVGLGFFLARSTQGGRLPGNSTESAGANGSERASSPASATPPPTPPGGNWPSQLTVQVPPMTNPAVNPPPATGPGAGTDNGPALTQMARAFLARPEQDSAMQAALRAKAARLPGLCPALSFVPDDTLVAGTPFPMFDNAGVMRRGLIRQRFTGVGCPNASPRFNIWIFAADPATPIKTVAGYMGSTHADPALQRDATPIAFGIAARLAPGCSMMSVLDTRLPRGVGAQAVPGPWAEEWLVGACGRYVQLTMHFSPEVNGTTRIEVPSTEARIISGS